MNSILLLLAVVVIVVMLPGIWVISLYNLLVKLRNHCRESWSNVDTELKRRYDLIPNLVAIVKGYTKHEHDTLEKVIHARNIAAAAHGSPATQAKDENTLIGLLRQLYAVVERYPVLKADQHYLQLQEELVNTEDRIQAARRFYNGNVRDLNTRLDVFPSNLVARLFRIQRADYFEIEAADQRSAGRVALGR